MKKYLLDVAAVRLILIFLLIYYHAFCIYSGGWPPPPGLEQIKFYKWISLGLHSCRLEVMVFISGLLLGYTSIRKKNVLSFQCCVVKKLKRIILPSLLFGILYYTLFKNMQAPFLKIVLSILNGCGHLWFLPMIFWCFVITYLLSRLISFSPVETNNCEKNTFGEMMKKFYRLNFSIKLVICISFICAVYFPLSFLPFGIGAFGRFFLYFFLGFLLKRGYYHIPKTNKKCLLSALLVFFVSIGFYLYLSQVTTSDTCFVVKILFYVFHTIVSLTAIYLFFSIANTDKVSNYLAERQSLITLSSYCYGVYIYHQFILVYLYDFTRLPSIISSIALPWFSAVLTLLFSLFLTHYTLKTRFGRFLIG